MQFEDGVEKKIDLEAYLQGPIFEPLRKDSTLFRSVKIEEGVLSWANGADIDPDTLYYNLKPARLENDAKATH